MFGYIKGRLELGDVMLCSLQTLIYSFEVKKITIAKHSDVGTMKYNFKQSNYLSHLKNSKY